MASDDVALVYTHPDKIALRIWHDYHMQETVVVGKVTTDQASAFTMGASTGERIVDGIEFFYGILSQVCESIWRSWAVISCS